MVNPVVGGALLAAGLACALRPHAVARFSEQVDAIGSKRSLDAVEPADWKVLLTRICGIGLSLFALLVFFDI